MTAPGATTALRAIAARSLGSASPGAIDAGAETALLLHEISHQRLTGLAVAAAECGDLHLGPDDLDELFDRHEEQMALDLRLEHLLCEVVAVLDNASIEYRALKGPVLAHTVYRDPAFRSFGDVDVLVRDTEFDAAIDALRALGFRRRFVEPRPGFDARFSKGACLERADGLELDLHRTLAPGAFGLRLARTDLLGPAPRLFTLGNTKVAGLDAELAFVHACFHAALGDDPPRLVPLRDVAELVRAGVDVGDAIERTAGVGCAAVLQRALNLVDQVLQIDLTDSMGSRTEMYSPTRFDRWILSSYRHGHRSYSGQAAVSFWTMRSMRDRVAFTRALAFPSRSYVYARGRGYTHRVAKSMQLLRDWRPR
jgi:Uncharacterised nucleotidyltransferase